MHRIFVVASVACSLVFLGGCGQEAGDEADAGGGRDARVRRSRDAQVEQEPDAGSDCPRPSSCEVRFAYLKGSETKVELMGSFNSWSAGVSMSAAGGEWETTISLPNDQDVAYKFLIDGKTWVSDPRNPRRSNDGDQNSLLLVSCAGTCAGPDAGGSGQDAGSAGADASQPTPDSGGFARDAGAGFDAGSPPDAGASGPDAGHAGPDAGAPGRDAGMPPDGGGIVDPCPPGRPLGDFREESIYFLMTTRFFNGDESNDYYNRDRLQIGDPQWRGDFKGLIQQLDYIKDTLGFTAIWITPVVENRSGLDYHGYHGYDFTKVDPRLESPGATFQDLICEMHKRDMRLVLDIVVNHSSNYGLRNKVHIKRAPIKYYRESGTFPSATCQAGGYTTHLGDYRSENREDDDNPLAPQVFHDFDPNGEKTINCPVCGGQIVTQGFSGWQNHSAQHFFNIDANTLDSTWYHQHGFMAGGDWESAFSLQQKHMAGDCIDLNTENAEVKKYIIDAYNQYLDMGVDALRIDTVKHVERGNLLEFVNAFKQRKPGLFVFGENLVKGTGWGTCLDGSDNGPADIRPWWYTRTTDDKCGGGKDDSGFSVLDFSLMSTFRDNLSQGRFSGVGSVFGRDSLYGDATKLVTFIDNHDIGPQNDWKYRYAGTDEALAAALNFIWVVRGIPCLFYGTEIRFMKGAEIDGNDAPHSTSGRAYFGDHLLPENIEATRNHKFVKQIKRLNQIRSASPALQKGWMDKFGDSDNSFWAVRNYNNGEAYAVVGVTQGGETFNVSGVKGGRYVDAVTGNQVTVSEGGTLTFTVKAQSAGIYILNGPGKIGEDGVYLR